MRELSRESLTPSRLEDLAVAFGRSDPVLEARLALAALVASGEPIGASGRTAPDDNAKRLLHLRLRALSPLSSPRRALALSLGCRSLTGGVGGLSALLAKAMLGDSRAGTDLRSRLAAGEADRHDLFFPGAVLVLPAPTVVSFLDELRQ